MPKLKRTPPASGSEQPESNVTRFLSKKNLTAQQSDTDPPLTGSDDDDRQHTSKSTQRLKRKYEGKDESESRSIIVEMRMLIGNLAAQQDKKIESLQKKFDYIEKLSDELMSIRNDIMEGRKEMADFIQACGTRMDSLETRILEIEKRLDQNNTEPSNVVENAVAELKQQLNDRDQELLLNDIEISGVPETTTESPLHVIKLLSINLGVEVDDQDIILAERVGSSRRNRMEDLPSRPRNLVVRMARRITRDQLLRAARVRRGLTTANLEMSIKSPSRVYLNERLTRPNRQLFGRAREQARKLGWKYVWTKDGKVLARKDDGRQVEYIRTEKDLVKIFGTSIV